MFFAQLTYRESLRDIETCLKAQRNKLYHMGIRSKIARNTLANANKTRDWRIYADFAQLLIIEAQELYSNEQFAVDLTQSAYALDSTTIDLSLSLFPWACFRKTKGGDQAAYPIGFARQYSHLYSYQRRQTARYKRTRRFGTGAGRFL